MIVSITTVCFNSASTLSRTIDSVLNQTYQDIEYIINGKSRSQPRYNDGRAKASG